MQSGCRWVYTLMDWDTGEVVAKGTSVELVPNDTRWSRKQLRKGCTDCKDSAYWWEQKYPGWKFVRCVVPEPESPGCEKEGWDADDLRCYVVMVKQKVGHAFAKPRT